MKIHTKATISMAIFQVYLVEPVVPQRCPRKRLETAGVVVFTCFLPFLMPSQQYQTTEGILWKWTNIYTNPR